MHPNFGGSVDVQGDAGDDTITAISAAGVVDGGAGADEITLNGLRRAAPRALRPPTAAPATDTISASAPTDMGLIDGGVGADTISTATFSRVDEIVGGAGADTITEVDGTSVIIGGLGADVIDGGGEGDTINCGLGLDQYVLYPGDTVAGCEIALP